MHWNCWQKYSFGWINEWMDGCKSLFKNCVQQLKNLVVYLNEHFNDGCNGYGHFSACAHSLTNVKGGQFTVQHRGYIVRHFQQLQKIDQINKMLWWFISICTSQFISTLLLLSPPLPLGLSQRMLVCIIWSAHVRNL